MPSSSRLAFIDALKAFAAQLIVLHHLAFYGPMSDVASPLAPALFSWLSNYARIAVHVFLVLGGFLAARSLAPNGVLRQSTLFAALAQRYFKLIIPFMVAILLSLPCAAIARQLMTHSSIPAAASVPQLIAHLFLLQSVLDIDSLSAGVWYVAIDFQLFSLLYIILWLTRRFKQNAAINYGLVSALAAASLFYFNRDARWDNYALYFFAAYALGALSYWIAQTVPYAGRWQIVLSIAVILALAIDFRSRIALALCLASSLYLAQRFAWLEKYPRGAYWAYLGKTSYALFLIHFPVCLLVNSVFTRFVPVNPRLHFGGVLLAWGLSLLASALFYRFIEVPSGVCLKRFCPPPAKILN